MASHLTHWTTERDSVEKEVEFAFSLIVASHLTRHCHGEQITVVVVVSASKHSGAIRVVCGLVPLSVKQRALGISN